MTFADYGRAHWGDSTAHTRHHSTTLCGRRQSLVMWHAQGAPTARSWPAAVNRKFSAPVARWRLRSRARSAAEDPPFFPDDLVHPSHRLDDLAGRARKLFSHARRYRTVHWMPIYPYGRYLQPERPGSRQFPYGFAAHCATSVTHVGERSEVNVADWKYSKLPRQHSNG